MDYQIEQIPVTNPGINGHVDGIDIQSCAYRNEEHRPENALFPPEPQPYNPYQYDGPKDQGWQ
jgi:hypothetical protein